MTVLGVAGGHVGIKFEELQSSIYILHYNMTSNLYRLLVTNYQSHEYLSLVPYLTERQDAVSSSALITVRVVENFGSPTKNMLMLY